MEILTMVIAVVAAIAAVAAAVFAGLQGVAAVGARKDAERARDEAREDAASAREQAERAIAESARRSSATESIAQALTRRGDPWVVERDTYSSHELRNGSERTVWTTRIEFVDENGDPAGRAKGTWVPVLDMEFSPRKRVRFEIDKGGSIADAAHVWIVVTWREADDPPGAEPRVWRQQLR